jgi:hypothetical protein
MGRIEEECIWSRVLLFGFAFFLRSVKRIGSGLDGRLRAFLGEVWFGFAI